MIKITFPDGSVRENEAGVTGLQIAQSISQRLAQDVLACGVDGETVELNRPIMQDANIVLYKWEDAEGKHAFWHTSAHLMAEALQALYPGTQFGIGPAIENGFYYDVMPPQGVVIREADFAQIEAKMKELAQRKENSSARTSARLTPCSSLAKAASTIRMNSSTTWRTAISPPTPRAHSPTSAVAPIC